MKCVLKRLGLAAISLACSIGFAQAQARGPEPLDAAALMSLVPRPPPAPPGVTVSGSGFIRNPNGTSPTISNGSNYRHCYAAIWYTDQTNFYMFGYNVEGDYIYYYVNSPLLTSAQVELKEICVVGHAYYAYQGSTGPYFVYELQLGF